MIRFYIQQAIYHLRENPVVSWISVLGYIVVMLILLIVPAINLSSMTLSRMRRRMAEIGVRKAFGATANELMRQVFLENLLMNLLSAGIPAWRASRMNIVEAINGKR